VNNLHRDQAQRRLNSSWDFVAPLMMGCIAFLLVVDWRALDPQNTAWLMSGDPLQHFLGWQFFRDSSWSLPLGLNPKNGLELSSSIVYSDSIPLIAMTLKVFNPLLPQIFQYFGMWLLACFALQAFFAWKLVSIASENILIKALGAGIFVFSLPMLSRLNEQTAHYALVGHFLILAALYLCFRPNQEYKRYEWPILLTLSVLIHFYIFSMVAAIWLAQYLDGIFQRKNITLKNVILELALVLTSVGLASWQAGYFVISGSSTYLEGYGWHSFNLLSLIDSKGWSYFMSPLKLSHSTAEDFNFLGAGVLFLIPFFFFAMYSIRRKIGPLVRQRKFLLATLIFLLLFSMSHHITVGPFSFDVYLPQSLFNIASILRSSARMFWPVYYTIIFCILYLIVISYSKKVAVVLLLIALALQITDTSLGWIQIHRRITHSINSNPQDRLINPFWKDLSKSYQNIKIYPLSQSQMQPNWGIFSKYAADTGLGTNAVYLARIDPNKINVSNKKFESNLTSNSFNGNDFFIVSDAAQLRVASSIEKTDAVFFKLDGFNVFIPKIKALTLPDSASTIAISDLLPKIYPNEVVEFTQASNLGPRLLGNGWSHAENWGTWSDENHTSLFIPTPNTDFVKISLQVQPFLPSKNYKQTVVFRSGGKTLKKLQLVNPDAQWIDLEIPPSNSALTYTRLDIEIPDAISPNTLQKSLDTRKLGIGIISLKLHR
jgi:hypothetical protein